MKTDIYTNGKQSVVIDNCNRFVYEVAVYVYYEKYTSMINREYFSSEVEILNVVDSHYIAKNIEVQCELYSAPKKWIIDNNYIKYEKKIKIVKPRVRKIIT